MELRKISLSVLLVCFILIAGCGSSYKTSKLDPAKLFSEKGRNALNSPDPSWETRQTLRLLFLEEEYNKNHKQAITKLEQLIKKHPTPGLRIALAELSLLEARKSQFSNKNKAFIYYLAAAQHAYDYLFFDAHGTESNLDPSFRFIAEIYNVALSEIISMRANSRDRKDALDFMLGGTLFHYKVVKHGDGLWDPALFDQIHNTYAVKVSGFENQYVSKGLGASLTGIVEKPSRNPAFGQFYPIKILAYPISAVLLFEEIKDTTPPSREVRLSFYDSLAIETIDIQDKTVPLEADFTKPLGLQLENMNPEKIGMHNLLESDVEIKNAGIYMLEPYRPDKIPVLMVHGLMSTPATWVNIFNDLRGDPELRRKYQFWFFMYPTGLPIGYSTSILREQLMAIHDKFDPHYANPNFNKMVIIGHSMGGLLTRGIVQDSGTKFWDFYFNEPYDTIDLDPDTKQNLKKVLFFEHLPL